jgi:cell division protein FtsA
MALHTPLRDAENVKIEYGSLNVTSNDVIELPTVGNENEFQEVSLEIVSNVIYARSEETLMILAKSLEKSGFKNTLGAGVVFTGGMTRLDGLRDLAVAVFDGLPVRFARPNDTDGLFDTLKDPSFSTVIGLVMYASGKHTLYEIDSNKILRYKETAQNIGASMNLPIDEMAEESGNYPKIDSTRSASANGTKNSNSKLVDKSVKSEAVENLTRHIDFPERKEGGVKNPFQKMWRWATQLF